MSELSRKLNPRRFPGMSPLMAAMHKACTVMQVAITKPLSRGDLSTYIQFCRRRRIG